MDRSEIELRERVKAAAQRLAIRTEILVEVGDDAGALLDAIVGQSEARLDLIRSYQEAVRLFRRQAERLVSGAADAVVVPVLEDEGRPASQEPGAILRMPPDAGP